VVKPSSISRIKSNPKQTRIAPCVGSESEVLGGNDYGVVLRKLRKTVQYGVSLSLCLSVFSVCTVIGKPVA